MRFTVLFSGRWSDLFSMSAQSRASHSIFISCGNRSAQTSTRNRRRGGVGSGSTITSAAAEAEHRRGRRTPRWCHGRFVRDRKERHRSRQGVPARNALPSRRKGVRWTCHARRHSAERSRERAGDREGSLGQRPFLRRWLPHRQRYRGNRSTSLPRAVLRGWRCSDGRLLRFWFYFHKNRPPEFSSPEQAAREESLSRTITGRYPARRSLRPAPSQ